MRTFHLRGTSLLLACFLLACSLPTLCTFAGQSKSSPGIPQTFPPPDPDRPHLQIDQPPTVTHGDHRVSVSPAQTRQEADQLAKLAQSIPPDVEKVSKGQLPSDLGARLKQIEKLAKQLRRDIGQ